MGGSDLEAIDRGIKDKKIAIGWSTTTRCG